MDGAKFTWLPKFTKTLLSVPEEHQAALFRALAQYGNYGIEPEFEDWALKAVFESLREDIDNNKSFRSSGASGGRGNRKRGSDAKRDAETPLSDGLNPPLEVCANDETQLCDCGEDEKRGSENRSSIPYQSIPNQPIPNQRVKRRRFTPPSVGEVRAYCEEKGYTFDPEAFHAFYESKGWKVGRNPMKSWQAACTTWQKRQGERKEANHDEYSDL